MRILLLVIFAALFWISGAFAEPEYLSNGLRASDLNANENDMSGSTQISDRWNRLKLCSIDTISEDNSLSANRPQKTPLDEQSPEKKDGPLQANDTRLTRSLDVRLKYGFAAGVDKIELPDISTTGTSDARGSNIQIEVAISPLQGSIVGPVFSLGPFMRTHSGEADDPLIRGSINYKASGLFFSGGLWIKPSDSLHVEVKAEFGFGSGWATLSNTRFVSGQTQGRSYVSGSAILGLYYSASIPGIQIGLELGWQSFGGRFEVQNSASKHWEGGNVEGSGVTANGALGYRF